MRKQLFRILTGLGAFAVFAGIAGLISYAVNFHPVIVVVTFILVVSWFIGILILGD